MNVGIYDINDLVENHKVLSEEQLDHLRDAIKFLSPPETLAVGPSARFMLARSYYEVGEYESAAKHFQWLLDKRDAVFKSCREETGPFFTDQYAERILRGLYMSLVSAWSQCSKIEKAISAIEKKWIKDFPNEWEPYERLSRLYCQELNYQGAYEALREAADRSSSLGEHPGYSIALALGPQAMRNSDEQFEKLAIEFQKSNPAEGPKIKNLLRRYWPAFRRIDSRSQEDWAVSDTLLLSDEPAHFGFAAHGYVRVLEQELRRSVFDKFQLAGPEHLPEHLRKSSIPADKVLVRLFQPGSHLTFGELLNTIRKSDHQSIGLLGSFKIWLKATHPKLAQNYESLDFNKLIDLRNKGAHGNFAYLPFTKEEAENCSVICRNILTSVRLT